MSKVKEKLLDIRQAGTSKGNVIEFTSLSNTAKDAEEFATYLKHISRGGVSDYTLEVNGLSLTYIAKTAPRRKGNVCHLIQKAALKHNTVIPIWIGNQAASYRYANGKPKLDGKRRKLVNSLPEVETKSPATVAEPVKKPVPVEVPVPTKVVKVKRTITKSKRTYYRVPAWKKFLRWLAK